MRKHFPKERIRLVFPEKRDRGVCFYRHSRKRELEGKKAKTDTQTEQTINRTEKKNNNSSLSLSFVEKRAVRPRGSHCSHPQVGESRSTEMYSNRDRFRPVKKK